MNWAGNTAWPTFPPISKSVRATSVPSSFHRHTGFTGTSFALDPTSGLYVIFLTNRICPSRDSLEIYRVRRLLHNAVYAATSR